MSSEHKKLIFNPVLSPPWKAHQKDYENPTLLLPKETRSSQPIESQIRRTQNVELLMMRFPGLKKYQAKAALTMSKNQLDKAIVLLEVSNCYRKEIAQKKMNSAYLKNIHINLRYDVEAQDPALRNIVFESSVCRGANESSSSVKKASCGSSTDSEAKFQSSETDRVGVVILKTPNGYRSTLL